METPPPLLSDEQLRSAAVEAEAAARAAHRRRLGLLAEAQRRGLDLAAYRLLLRADRAEFTRWLTQVRLFLPALSPSGQPLPPAHPVTAAALPELSEAHLAQLARALPRLPEGAEDILVTAARSTEPRALRLLADRIHAEQDAAEPGPEPEAEAPDVLHLRDLPGGRLELWGELTAETGARLTAALDPLARPGAEDTRSRAERQGQALADLIDLRGEALPTRAGQRPHLSVTLDYQTLRTGTGTARLDGGGHLTAAQARRLACDAVVIPAVLGGRSEVLDLGRARRTVSLAQRRALHARDRGCAFPGCGRPARWCDAHHVRHWADGGPTDLDNLVLLCRRHHSEVHHHRWRIRLTGGAAVFIPPRHIDPAQLPRQNLLHRRALELAG
ncbi:hypothetical protein JOF41_006633 [Saccharothrix coeruleofusca]|uniref:HNH endonuclease signature motif containing protein n=1 Tax=Saccharothrix coeruleofusca TaxID=33919 RepID=UPI001AE0F52A|nr:HNH endonuclease signature motif containing protein [Saccharothrix coeruleofusca]MBP2340455.1 hypothetical protein [Saccharothrix coeruleofusca]